MFLKWWWKFLCLFISSSSSFYICFLSLLNNTSRYIHFVLSLSPLIKRLGYSCSFVRLYLFLFAFLIILYWVQINFVTVPKLYLRCIKVVQRWKSNVGFCFIFNVGSMLFQLWWQRWNKVNPTLKCLVG